MNIPQLSTSEVHAENQQLREHVRRLTQELSQVKTSESGLQKQIYALRQLAERLRDKNLQNALTASERQFLNICNAMMTQSGKIEITDELTDLIKSATDERSLACINRGWNGGGVVGVGGKNEN